ncbi:hypothetical protein Tco_1267954, partial [Tanacetum coccineum]
MLGIVHYILPGLSSKTRALWKLSCLLEAARQSLVCIRPGLRGQSYLYAPSTGCGPDVCAIRHCASVVSVLALMETTLYLLCRHRSLLPEETVVPYLLRDCRSLPSDETATPYFLRRHCSLVIAS